MASEKSWKVLRWDDQPEQIGDGLMLACSNCGNDALMPTGIFKSPVIAAIGLSLVFDNPSYVPEENLMPSEVQCRKCKTIWTSDPDREVDNVR